MALTLGDPKVLKARLTFLEKEVGRQPLLFARIADYYIVQGKHKKAQKILAKGLSQYPNYASGWVVAGNLYLSLEQRNEALTAFKRALKIDPVNQYAHARCSDLAFELNKYDDYFFHIISLSLLDLMNGKVRQMERNEILRRLAVKAGYYSLKEAHRQHPEHLARKLRGDNLLPPELQEDSSIESVDLPDVPEDYKDYYHSAPVDQQEAEKPSVEFEPAVEEELPEEALSVDEEPDEAAPKTAVLTAEPDEELRLRSMVETLTQEFRPSVAKAPPVEPEPPAEKIEAPQEPSVSGAEFPPSVRTEAGMFEIYREVPAPSVSPPLSKRPESPASADIEPPQTLQPSSPAESDVAEIVAEPEPPRAFRIEQFVEEEPEAEEPSEIPEEMPNIKVKLRDEKSAEFSLGQDRGSKLQSIQQKSDDETRKLLAQIAKEVTEGDVALEPENDDLEDGSKRKSKRIITRTRAELYASQGDLDEAIEIYEDLVVLHPDNQSYRNRLEEIKEKLEAQKAKEEEKKQRENRT